MLGLPHLLMWCLGHTVVTGARVVIAFAVVAARQTTSYSDARTLCVHGCQAHPFGQMGEGGCKHLLQGWQVPESLSVRSGWLQATSARI